MDKRRNNRKAAFQTLHLGVRFFVAVFLGSGLPLLFWGGAGVFAVELSTTLGAVGFDPFLAEISGEDTRFDTFHIVGNVAADFDVSKFIGLTLSVEQDPVLMTRILPLAGFTSNVLSVKAGPFLGFLDPLNPDVKPGLSVALDVAAPGIVFGSIRFDTSISVGSLTPETFIQKYWMVKAGFWVPHIIFSLGAESRSLSEERSSGVFTNEWNKYTLSADFFQKNVPRTFRLDVGLQNLKWVPQDAPEEGYNVNSIFVGAEFHWQITQLFKLVLGGEGAVYSWNADQDIAQGDPPGLLFYGVHVGMVWSIGK
jgi:hypothetical protein